MFDEDEDKTANEETLPDTPLHAYGQGREEDVEGDVEDLTSGVPDRSRRTDISEGDESSDFPEHPKE